GQSIQSPRYDTSLEPSGSVGARRLQSAGLGPSASGWERSRHHSSRSVVGSHAPIGLTLAAVHSEEQTKEKEEASALHCTALRWCNSFTRDCEFGFCAFCPNTKSPRPG